MKTEMISVLSVLLLSISMAGCSGGFRNNSSTGRSQIPDTSVPESSASSFSGSSADSSKTSDAGILVSSSSAPVSSKESSKAPTPSDHSVLEAYKAVLKNKAELFSTDSKKKIYLQDFLTNKEIYGTEFTVTHFAVLDMDGDKVPEAVLELSVNNEPQFYEVLHEMDGTVCGYLIVYRGLESLKADGTFQYSSGAEDTGIGKLKFGATAFRTEVSDYSESGQGGTVSFFIDKKPVSKEAYDSLLKDQSGKKDAAWYEFSPEKIEAELSGNSQFNGLTKGKTE